MRNCSFAPYFKPSGFFLLAFLLHFSAVAQLQLGGSTPDPGEDKYPRSPDQQSQGSQAEYQTGTNLNTDLEVRAIPNVGAPRSGNLISRKGMEPCAITLTIENLCSGTATGQKAPPYQNTLQWTNPNETCAGAGAVVGYRLFYAATENETPVLIKEISGATNTTFVHTTGNQVAGCYVLTAVDAGGTEVSSSVKKCVDNCPKYELPNAFTPDGDGFNDTFGPLPGWRFIDHVEMEVYNRWGQLVFATQDPAVNWDGKQSGIILPDGTYFFSCVIYEKRIAGVALKETQRGYLAIVRDVRDTQPPAIHNCPSNITIRLSGNQCTAVANWTVPTATDNENILGSTVARLEGTHQPGDVFPTGTTVVRYTATDLFKNAATCTFNVTVQDEIPPMITCPGNITVTCNSTPATSAQSATAVDNCDPHPAVQASDSIKTGDCIWACQIERTWEATDASKNIARCVQTITKDIGPLIESALRQDIDGDGRPDTLTLGASRSTLAFPPGSGACLQQWLPVQGNTASGLKFKNSIVGPDCLPGDNPLDVNGHLTNRLLGEALKLQILVRLQPNLGPTKLSTLHCNIPASIINALKPNPDVNELLRVTNSALGNITLQPHLTDLLNALICLNTPLAFCN